MLKYLIYHVLSNILSIMSSHSMIQAVPFCITPEQKTVKTVLTHYLYLILTIQATRYCVKRSFFIVSISTKVRFGVEDIMPT